MYEVAKHIFYRLKEKNIILPYIKYNSIIYDNIYFEWEDTNPKIGMEITKYVNYNDNEYIVLIYRGDTGLSFKCFYPFKDKSELEEGLGYLEYLLNYKD